MANIPKTMAGLLEWAPGHAAQWLGHAAALGLDPLAAQRFVDEVEAFELRKAQSLAAHRAAENATARLNTQEQAVRGLAGALVRQIKAHAEAVGDPSLILLAQLRQDAAPGTLPPPLPPREFTWSMDSLGALTIRWKVRQPKGVQNVTYNITRSLDGGPFAPVGSVGSAKRFTDTTLPAGTALVAYMIEPMRGGVRGEPSREFIIRFGRGRAAVTQGGAAAAA